MSVHPDQPGLQMMAVNVPDGVMPGSVFNVSTPSGAMMAVTCPSTSKPGDQIQIAVPAGPVVTSALELALEKEDLVRVSKPAKLEYFGNNDRAAQAGTDHISKHFWKYAGGYKAEFKVTGGSGTQIGVMHVRTDNVLNEPCKVQIVSPSGETLMSYEIAGIAKWWKTTTDVPVRLSGQAYASCTTSIAMGSDKWRSIIRVTRADGSGGLLFAPPDTGCGSTYCTLTIIGLVLFIFVVGIIFLCLAFATPVAGRVTSLDGTAEYAPHVEARGIKTVNFVPNPKYTTYNAKAKVDALIGISMDAVILLHGLSQVPPG